MTVFKFLEYKRFIQTYIENLPQRGRGEIARIAEILDVAPTLISQIINGPKNFTLEQGFELTVYLKLNDPESEYFILMLEHDRAGTNRLRDFFKARLKKLQRESKQLKKRVTVDLSLNEQSQAQFYSSSVYSCLRLACDIPGLKRPEDLAAKFGLPLTKVKTVLGFLVEHGLCIEKNGNYSMGPSRTHIPHDSPIVGRHHLNWRLKAIERIENLSEDDLMYTCPIVISKKDYALFREELAALVQQIQSRLRTSDSELLCCLNVDLFEVS